MTSLIAIHRRERGYPDKERWATTFDIIRASCRKMTREIVQGGVDTEPLVYGFPDKTKTAFQRERAARGDVISAASVTVMNAVVATSGIDVKQIVGSQRSKKTSDARWVIAAILYDNHGYTAAAIGRLLHKDHTSILHALKKRWLWDGETRDLYTRVCERLDGM